jgi:hypothetical protein
MRPASYAVGAIALALLPSCKHAAPTPVLTADVHVVSNSVLPSAPDDPIWNTTPAHHERLLPQDMVDPRLMTPSTPEVAVQAITNGTEVVFRLAWADTTQSDVPDTGRFSDACAVQLPSTAAADIPAPQMGESGRPVEITYWSAAMQASVNGRPDNINAIHPNAPPFHYPFEAAPLKSGSPEQAEAARRYAPAKAVGNVVSGPYDRPVQDLIAEGPGSLRPAQKTTSQGKGVRTKTGWEVVIRRAWPAGLQSARQSQVAFAVWEGAHQEAGARKMRTAWVPLSVEAQK